MNEHAKSDIAEAERCDSPTVPESQQQQAQQENKMSPISVEMDSQALNPPYAPTGTLPLSSVNAQTTTPIKKQTIVSAADRRPFSPVKDVGSRSSSPVKRPSSRPSSRSNSPHKWTPAPGKNEHFETTPTGFRYTIELPESKIVSKKASSPSLNKVTITPVRSRAGTPTKTQQVAASPSKSRSQSPRKEVLKRATSPEKKGPGTDLHGYAEPSPTGAPPGPSNHRKRVSVKLMKTTGTHVGTPTVEVTKKDVWTPKQQLRTPVLPSKGSLSTKTNGEKVEMKDRGSHMKDILVTPRRASYAGPLTKSLTNEEKGKENPMRGLTSRPPITPSIPMDFGEMLRNSSQDVREMSAKPSGVAQLEKAFSSPTILDKVRRKSDIKTVSFLGLVTKPQADGRTAVAVAAAPGPKDLANGVKIMPTKDNTKGPDEGSHGSAASRPPALNKSPQTPIGTPPALVVAMEAEMNDIRTSLQRSLGNGYDEVSPSPVPTRWLGSSKNSKTSTIVSVEEDPQGIGNTPRLNLHKRMEAAKKVFSPRSNGSKHVRNGAPSAPIVKTNGHGRPETETPFQSRLPRVSPAKLKAKSHPRTPGTIPQAPRASLVDHPQSVLSSPGGVPSMASRRAQYARVAQGDGEIIGFASAEEIAEHVREWNSKPLEKTSAASSSKKSPVNPDTRLAGRMTTTTRSTPTFMSPTATSAKKQTSQKVQESFTPPGSPPKPAFPPHSARKAPPRPAAPTAHSAKKLSSSPKKPKATNFAVPRTPLPRRSVLQRGRAVDQGAVRTPSKEMVSKLDREINAHLVSQERQGRIYTPSGQRIKDLLAATRKSEGEGD